MLLIAVLALGFVVATGWALARWPGRGRWLAGAPLLLVSTAGLRSVVETSVDPTSANLWPFEVLGVMVLVGVALGGLQLGGVIGARSARTESS